LTFWLVIGGARFWASLDLLEYFEPSNFKRGVIFPGLKRTKRLISIRLPEQLLVRVKDKANKLYTPYQNLIQQHIQQGLKNKELSHSMHFLSVHGIVRSWRRRGLSGQAKTSSRAYAYLKKRSQWMRCRSYRRQHLPIVSGITEAACKVVFTQRLKCSGMAWTRDGGQVILDLRVIRLSGVWEDVHQRYLVSKPMPVTQGDRAKGAQRQQAA